MNWVQKNPFLTAFLGGTLLAAAGAAYFTFTAFGRFTEVSEQYDSAVSRLHGLQNRTPYPSEENLKAFAELTSAYDAKFDELLAAIAKRQSAVESITPQAFQDNLRAVVSSVTELARENNVELPEGFYLGFDQYRGTLPSDNAAPALAHQLQGVQAIVTDLIKLRVNAITALSRVPLQQEGGARPAAQGQRAENAQNAKESTEPILVINPIDISFRAEQARVRQALNGIVTSDRFFIIRSLTIQNTQTEGPARQAAASATSADSGANNAFAELLGNNQAQSAAPRSTLSVIVGRELVNVNTRIEMIGFNLPKNKK